MKRYLLSLISLLTVSMSVEAQNNSFGVDDSVYDYYLECEKMEGDSLVLTMADTLYDMAGAVDDKRMQAVALNKKLDYYYLRTNHSDSYEFKKTIEWIDTVRKYSKETDQPKYYFFAWTRLITCYLRCNMYNLAFVEMENMQKEAIAEDYKLGVADSYKLLARFYIDQNQNAMSAEYFQKAIDYIIDNDIEDYNMANNYSSMSAALEKDGRIEEALEAVRRAEETANSPAHLLEAKASYARIYINNKEYEKAKEIIDECMESEYLSGTLHNILVKFLMNYYYGTGQYAKALEESDYFGGIDDAGGAILLTRARIFGKLGDPANAYEYYERLINMKDSMAVAKTGQLLAEYAMIIEKNDLESRNRQLETEAAQTKLSMNRRIMFILAIATLGLTAMVLWGMKLLRRLRKSRSELVKRNVELVEAESAIRIAKEQAESANLMKTALIQNMSHEVRTPLNAVVGFASLLAEGTADEVEQKEYMDILTSNSAKLLKLIDGMIDMSHLDALGAPPKTNRFSLENCCIAVVEDVRAGLADGVDISYSISDSVGTICGYEYGIHTILANLLANSCKFTQKGHIDVACTAAEDGRTLMIVVTDTGIGVPVDKQEWVFERFNKVDSFSQGAGLGLSFCRLQAVRLGGWVRIDPAYTDGCRVIVSLPMAGDEDTQM